MDKRTKRVIKQMFSFSKKITKYFFINVYVFWNMNDRQTGGRNNVKSRFKKLIIIAEKI